MPSTLQLCEQCAAPRHAGSDPCPHCGHLPTDASPEGGRARWAWLPLLGLSVVGLSASAAACNEDIESTDTPVETDTPGVTGTAAPTLMDDWFRSTAMSVGTSNEGVDVDGDGTVDNNIEVTLETISNTIYDEVEAAVCVEGVDCSAPLYAQALSAVEKLLDGVFSVAALSNALNHGIEDGSLNYLENFRGDSRGTSVTLNWTTGTYSELGYAPGGSVGTQKGSLKDGAGEFGPGDLSLFFSFSQALPDGQTVSAEYEIVLYQGRSVVKNYNTEELSAASDEFLTGGAISMEDMMEIVDDSLNLVADTLAMLPADNPPVIDADGISAAVEAELAYSSDIALSTGPGFSIGLVVNAKGIILQE